MLVQIYQVQFSDLIADQIMLGTGGSKPKGLVTLIKRFLFPM